MRDIVLLIAVSAIPVALAALCLLAMRVVRQFSRSGWEGIRIHQMNGVDLSTSAGDHRNTRRAEAPPKEINLFLRDAGGQIVGKYELRAGCSIHIERKPVPGEIVTVGKEN